jgi:hypothetical protein
MIGWLGFILLIVLPGAWITFASPFKGLPFWARLLIGIMLAPLVIAVQFYLLRMIGAPFELTTSLLVALNLPALYLLYRERSSGALPRRTTLLGLGMVLLVILLSIAPFLLDPQKRLYTWEAWSQADVVYALANGELLLEDAELSGVRLSYPWAGHVYQAVLSYVADDPPITNYIWVNLVWLVCIFGLLAGLVAELGGNALAQIGAAAWLSFGVNFVGGTLGPLIPAAWISRYNFLGNIWGDSRYTPWVEKVLFFGQMYFALGLFIAILYLAIRPWPDRQRIYHAALIGLLLSGISLIYPVLLPPACAVVGARVLVVLLGRWTDRSPVQYSEAVALGAMIALSGAIAYINTQFLVSGRASASLAQLHDLHFMRWRIAESLVVTSPLLAGLALTLRYVWQVRRHAILILGLGALASFVPYILYDIPWWRNEYKFIFTAAICLAPFPGLALQPIMNRLGRWALPALAALTVILAAPFVVKVYQSGDVLYTKQGAVIDVQHFDVRLSDQEPLARLFDNIRQETPVETLLVLERAEVHTPTLAQRQLYAPPPQAAPYPGILVTSDELLTLVKGNPAQVVADRRATLHALFDSSDKAKMAQSLHTMLQFRRPLALILDEQRQAAVLGWLTGEHIGRLIYRGNGLALWLIEPGEGVD